ncbi:MAG: DUF983 domain-containing protein, partial [Polymorphobacter sp.]
MTDASPDPATPAPALVLTALRGGCPRCGGGGLFGGIVTFAPRCRQCDLDFAAFNVGDGAASFLIFIVGGIILGLALWLELSFSPPVWVHALLWIPLATLLTLVLLRLAKALLIAMEYRHHAAAARS